MLTDMKVLVTGATGFIGGRLVEKLILEHHVQVRALVRNFGSASRLARFPVEMMGGEVSDARRIDQAVAGCDVVVHCAHDFADPDANLAGARAIADACLRHGVRRLVYLSSIAVYDPLTEPTVDETRAAGPTGSPYGDNKQAIERLLLEDAQQRNLPVVILQPTIVFGPFSGAWTHGPMRLLRNGPLALPDGGRGVCNAVYVDDVVDAMLLAATAEGVDGERFLISGSAPVTWSEFFNAYARGAGLISPVTTMSNGDIANVSQAFDGLAARLRAVLSDPIRVVGLWPIHPVYLRVRALTEGSLWDFVYQHVRPQVRVPDPGLLGTFSARSAVRIDKARRLLGYEPRFDLERGMAVTLRYVEWANL